MYMKLKGKEVMSLLGISRGELEKLIEDGELKAKNIGKGYQIDEHDFNVYISRHDILLRDADDKNTDEGKETENIDYSLAKSKNDTGTTITYVSNAEEDITESDLFEED